VSVREIVLRIIHPSRPANCALQKGPIESATHVEPPSQEEIDETRKRWRDEIHKNRNNLTVSVQIARRMERASNTMLEAANEMVAEMQKGRERIH
jgi:hypothetical protein